MRLVLNSSTNAIFCCCQKCNYFKKKTIKFQAQFKAVCIIEKSISNKQLMCSLSDDTQGHFIQVLWHQKENKSECNEIRNTSNIKEYCPYHSIELFMLKIAYPGHKFSKYRRLYTHNIHRDNQCNVDNILYAYAITCCFVEFCYTLKV